MIFQRPQILFLKEDFPPFLKGISQNNSTQQTIQKPYKNQAGNKQ